MLIGATLASVTCGQGTSNSVAFATPSKWARDQPSISRLFTWEGKLIAKSSEGYHDVRISKDIALPLFRQGGWKILDLAQHGSRRYMLAERRGGHSVTKFGEDWNLPDLPLEAAEQAYPPTLIATPTGCALLYKDFLLRLDGAGWKKVPLRLDNPDAKYSFRNGPPSVWARRGSTLWIGYNRGEWGGGLATLNMYSGVWKWILPADGETLPVTGLSLDRMAHLWMTQGLSHLSGISGEVSRFNGKGWKTLVRTSNYRPNFSLNWSLPPVEFEDITFDSAGVPHVLTSQLGILSLRAGRWRQETAQWGGHAYVSALHIPRPGIAVIGTGDSGILVWNLRTGKARRITLAQELNPIPE